MKKKASFFFRGARFCYLCARMKTCAKFFLTAILGFTAAVNAMDENGWASIHETIAAFEDRPGDVTGWFNRPGYVKPIVTNLGNVLNSNWYVNASVPQSLTFEIGLPISLISIGSDDQEFTENGRKVPTIFGTHGNPQIQDGIIYGNENLNGLGVFTYPYLQFAASFYHARIALRGMAIPSIQELRKFNLFGIGLQYSFGHLFQYMLPKPAQGLDVSMVFGYNTSNIGYRPKGYDGSLDLNISAITFDFVIGYKPISTVELMMTLGYQYANMESSGALANKENPYLAFHPNISVKGNNGFKFGIAVAFQLGKTFHPVVGFDYAGKSSYTLNVLYVKQQFGTDKTPDEIAKEKGYVRGAAKPQTGAEQKNAEQGSSANSEATETTAQENSAEAASENPTAETPSAEQATTENF